MSNQENFISKNVSEDLVDMYLDNCITAAGMCSCPRCRADVRAYALNNFPPRYVVTDLGDALVRVNILSNQFRADIIIAIMNGINIVMRYPRHILAETPKEITFGEMESALTKPAAQHG